MNISAYENGGEMIEQHNNTEDIESITLTGRFTNLQNCFNNCPNLKEVSISSASLISDCFNNCPKLDKVIIEFAQDIHRSFNNGMIKKLSLHCPCEIGYSFKNIGHEELNVNRLLSAVEYLKIDGGIGAFRLHSMPDASTIYIGGEVLTEFHGIKYLGQQIKFSVVFIIIDAELSRRALVGLGLLDTNIKSIYLSDKALKLAKELDSKKISIRNSADKEFLVESESSARLLKAIGIVNCRIIQGTKQALAIAREKVRERREKVSKLLATYNKLKLLGVDEEFLELDYIENAIKLLELQRKTVEDYSISEDRIDFLGEQVPLYVVNLLKVLRFNGEPLIEGVDNILPYEEPDEDYDYYDDCDDDYDEDEPWELFATLDGKVRVLTKECPDNTSNIEYKIIAIHMYNNLFMYRVMVHSESLCSLYFNYIPLIKHIRFQEGDTFTLHFLWGKNEKFLDSLVVGGMKFPVSMRRTVESAISRCLMGIGYYYTENELNLILFNPFSGEVLVVALQNSVTANRKLRKNKPALTLCIIKINDYSELLPNENFELPVVVRSVYTDLETFIESCPEIMDMVKECRDYWGLNSKEDNPYVSSQDTF